MKITNGKKARLGFTLVELLVVMAIVGILSTVIISILFSVLRGTNKTNSVTLIRQNGNYALNQMTRIVRSGTSISTATPCNGVPGQRLDINQLDGSTTQLFCSPSNGIYYTDASGKTTLIDKAVMTVSACTIVCEENATTSIPFVNILYTVTQYGTATSENAASVTFNGSAQLRNTQQ